MTARDRYHIDLKCKGCGATGKEHHSEADGWAHKNNPDPSFDGFEGPFKVNGERVVCANCGTDVKASP